MKILIKDLKVIPFATGGVGLNFDTNYRNILKLKELKEEEYELSITPLSKKRSLAQNRYLWALISEICLAENGNEAETEEIYLQLITEAGAKVEYILALPETESSLKQVFRAVTKVDEREYNGKLMHMYKCFAGSSTFDTVQMTRLIEATLRRAEEDGIETDYWKGILSQ